jgi:hypothetical protein
MFVWLFLRWWRVPENPLITEAGETPCLYQYEPKKAVPVIALIKQKAIHLTVCLKHHLSKSLNSYYEMRLCIMFVLTVIPSSCYCIVFQVLYKNEILIDSVCLDMRYLCEKWCKKREFCHKFQNVSFEVLITMCLKIWVFWDVMLCQLVSSRWRFGVTLVPQDIDYRIPVSMV